MKKPAFLNVLIFLIILFIAGTVWFNLARISRNPINRIDIPTQAGLPTKGDVSDFEQIAGTDILRASLYVSNDERGLSSYKGYQPVQNYIFFNTTNQTFSLLKPTDQSLLLTTLNLTELKPEPNSEPRNAELNTEIANSRSGITTKVNPAGFVYLVADQDTNNDRQIDNADLKKIAISDVSGLRYKVLFDRVMQLKGVSAVKNNRVFIFYLVDQQIKSAEVDLRSQSVINTSVLKNN